MTTRHCSLGDDRSWTDLVTNTVSLSSVRVADLEALLGWGTVPRSLLPAFVHEAVHHWCFLSPVGSAIAYLQLRARRRGVLLYNGQGDADELELQILDDLVRADVGAALLRPLAEGLALFAEFDVTSGPESRVMSTPLRLVGAFFGIRDISHKDTGIVLPLMAPLLPLREWRASDDAMRRKANVLGHPLRTEGGGYLPGYLTVRDLWLRAAVSDMRLAKETELALMFIRSWFYDDAVLVERLLDSERFGVEAVVPIAEHIEARFDALRRFDWSGLHDYEDELVGRPNDHYLALRSIGITDEDRQRGERLLLAMQTDVERVDLESVEGLLALYHAQLLTRRDVMYFGSVPVEVAVDADGTYAVELGSAAVNRGKALEGVEPGRAAGFIHLFFSVLTPHGVRVCGVTRGDELVATIFGASEALSGEERERFARFDADQGKYQSSADEMREYTETAVARSSVAAIVADVRSALPEIVERIYIPDLLRATPQDAVESVIERTWDDGLLDLLNWRRDLLNGLALIGLAWPRRLTRPEVETEFSERGLELDTVLKALDECADHHGFARVYDSDDLLLSTV